MANAYRKEQMKLYQRGRRANLKAIRDPLKTLVHSGISVKIESRDGVQGLYVSAKFNQAQLDALEELARMEHTLIAETMVDGYARRRSCSPGGETGTPRGPTRNEGKEKSAAGNFRASDA